MLQPTTFSLINLILDLVLMVLLSTYLPRHIPRLFVLLVICNISQHFISVPIDQIPGLKKEGTPTPSLGQILQTLRSTDLRSGTFQLPPPQIILPSLLQFAAESQGKSSPLELFFAGEQKKKVEQDFRVRWMAAMRDDPYAVWLFVRVFWFAATLVIFLQRPALGAEVVAFQLIPIPFLSLAIPYAYFWLSNHPFVVGMEQLVREPQSWDRFVTPPVQLFIILLSFGLMLLVLLVWLLPRLKNSVRKRIHIDQYLDPDLYRVRLNGELLPFSVDGTRIVISGIPFECRHVTVDPDCPTVWRLSSNTVLEFEKK